jgi:hypothetical protein
MLVERVFGWAKLDHMLRQIKMRGLKRVDWAFQLGRHSTESPPHENAAGYSVGPGKRCARTVGIAFTRKPNR